MIDSQDLFVKFRDEYGIPVDPTFDLIESSHKIRDRDWFEPHYILRGFFRQINKYQAIEFIISEEGPDAMMITDIPLGTARHPYLTEWKFKNVEWMTYWENPKKRYLIQVIANLYY